MTVSPVRDICCIFEASAVFYLAAIHVANALFLTPVNYRLTTEVNSHSPPHTEH